MRLFLRSALLAVAVGLMPVLLRRADGASPSKQDIPGTTYLWESGQSYSHWLAANKQQFRKSIACSVRYTWFNERARLGSGVNAIADFVVTPGMDAVTGKLPGPMPDLQPRIGVNFLPFPDSAPIGHLTLSIALEGEAGSAFQEISRSEASTTIRGKHWEPLTVSKFTRRGIFTYTFTLNCSPGSDYFASQAKLYPSRQSRSRDDSTVLIR